MKKLILIGGDLASGKTTFSKYLAKKYNLTLINKDYLKEMVGDIFYASNREENLKLSKLSFEFIKYIIQVSRASLIVESNFKTYEMEELKKFEKDYDVLSLKFMGDYKLTHNRFIKRLDEGRHYVHKAQDFSNIEDFIKMIDGLREVKYIGKQVDVLVDESNTSENVRLNKIIDDFMKE